MPLIETRNIKQCKLLSMPSMIGAHILSFCNMGTRQTFALSSKGCCKLSSIPIANNDLIVDRKFVKYMLSDAFNAMKYRNIKHLDLKAWNNQIL